MPLSKPADAVRDSSRGRLRSPAVTGETGPAAPAGRHDIEVDGAVAGICLVPPAPRHLVIMLHGAGGTAEAGLALLAPYADRHGLAIYAPKSVGITWDRILGGYGPDVRRLQQALDQLAARLPGLGPPIIGGFSDGASYALSLALANGDVVDRALAFSPGFAAPEERVGRPRMFISHGRQDRVLPIERCGRRVARVLRDTGYTVEYLEFDGGHDVPADVVTAALAWLSEPPTD